MALEDLQIADNTGNAYFANASPSNNPSQVTQDLIEGADIAGKIRELGYKDEIGATIFTKLLQDGKTKGEALAVLADNADVLAGDGEIRGAKLLDLPEVDPFGEDQSEYYEYKEGDTQYDDQQRMKLVDEMNSMVEYDEPTARSGWKEQVAYDYGKPILKTGVLPEHYDALAEELAGYREEQPVTVSQGRRFEDSAAEARAGRQSSRRSVRDMLKDDASRSSSKRKGYSDVKAMIEAENILRNAESGNMDVRDRISDEMYMRHMAPVAEKMTFDPLLQAASGGGDPYTYVDPATQAPLTDPNFADPANSPDVAQALNAPSNPRSTIDWVDANKPGFSEGGRMFGNFPQVDITGAGNLFGERYGKHIVPHLGGRAVPADIRGLSEMQGAVNMGLDALVAKKAKLYDKEMVTDPSSGRTSMKTSVSKDPGVDALLNKMRYTPAEKSQLANAMMQLESATRKGSPSPGMRAFTQREVLAGPLDKSQGKVFFQSPEAINPSEGFSAVARINPGQQVDGQDIVSAFRNLDSSDAQKPFIGQVEGESPRMYRYNKTGESSMEGIERVMREKEEQNAINRVTDKRGNRKRNKWNLPMRPEAVNEDDLRQKVVKAALAEERSLRDNRIRVEKERTIRPYRVRIGG